MRQYFSTKVTSHHAIRVHCKDNISLYFLDCHHTKIFISYTFYKDCSHLHRPLHVPLGYSTIFPNSATLHHSVYSGHCLLKGKNAFQMNIKLAENVIYKKVNCLCKSLDKKNLQPGTVIDVDYVGDVIFDDVVDQDPIVSVRIVRKHSLVQNLWLKYYLCVSA